MLLRYSNCIKYLVLVVLIVLLGGSVWYVHTFVLGRTLDKAFQEVSSDLSKSFNAVLSKYTGLLSNVPAHVSANPYHINLMVKLRAEFIQAFRELDGVTAVLYNHMGNVMFTVGRNSDEEITEVESLSERQLSSLRQGNVLYEDLTQGLSSAIFPVLATSGDYVGFLRITKDCSEMASFFGATYRLFDALIGIAIAAFIGAILFVYRKNTKLISSQYDVNLELQEKKETAEKESVSKSEFLANVSHELRTPLNSIIGFSEIIQGESLGPIGNNQYKEYVRDIHQAGVHLLSLINDILDFSKAEANKLTVELVKFDLGKIIDSCFQMLLPRAQEAKVEMKKEMPAKAVVMFADPKRMKQVLINVLSNSLKFTPESGLVKLSVEIKGGELTLEISDTGIGIAQQDLYKVMSVFGQADSKHSRKYEGTGLGLPLSKKLVELMGGVFHIKSEPNLGTVITLVFPQKVAEKEERGF